MAETTSTPPNQDGEGDTQSRPTTPSQAAGPSPCDAPQVAPQARRGERVIVPQTATPAADRTEDYLRGPTAYCA